MLRAVTRGRTGGVLLRRLRFLKGDRVPLARMGQTELADELAAREAAETKRLGRETTRLERARVARTLWRDAGAIKTDKIRIAFMQITKVIGLPEVTAPKCWRHTFATLMQEANVDPLIRQQTMGHVPAGLGRGALGMTADYTHTRLEVHREQLQRIIDLRPKTSEIVAKFLGKDPEERSDKEI